MNFQITQGTGTTIATDVGGGGENYQKIKLIDATPGSTTGAGISTNPWWIQGTVTANLGTIAGIALDSSVNGILVQQGSITSGQFGPLIQGAVTTSVPSYATGTTAPLSLTLTGALRVDVDNFPSTFNNNLVSVSGSPISFGQQTMANSLPVTFASDQTALPPSTDVYVTGTLSGPSDTVVINCNALSTVGWTTSGVWSGTQTMEVQYGDGVWFVVEVIDTTSGQPFIVTQWTESLNNQPWITNVAGATQARIRFTTYNSGTAVITFNGSIGINAVRAYNRNANMFLTQSWLRDGSGNAITSTASHLDINVTNPTLAVTQSGVWTVKLATESIEIGTVDQGTPNTLANAWPVEVTDGTNVLGTSAHPFRVDPTGTTTQPVNVTNATLAVTQSGSWSVAQSGAWTTGRTWVLSSGADSVSSVQSGTWSMRNQDGAGNSLTSQANGGQRALDVGIDVAGVQIDPRQIRALTSSDVVTANQGGVWSTGRTWTLSNGTDSIAASQSGTWNITNISGTITLPTGASTSLNQTSGSQKTQIVDGSGNVIASTANALNTSAVQAGTWTVQPGNTANTTPWLMTISQGGNVANVSAANALKVDGSAVTQPISGTVTSNQGTPNSLANAWSVEVTDGTSILGTNTHPFRIDPTGTTIQPVSGTVTANQGGAPWSNNVTQIAGSAIATAASGIAKIGLTDGTGTAITSTTSALDINIKSFSGVTVLAPLPVSAAQGTSPWVTNITQVAGSAISTAAAGIAKVGLTDGSGNAITSTSNAIDENLKSWLGSTAPTVGQKAMASSVPVVIASDQTSLKTLQDIAASGNIVAVNGAVTATINGVGACVFELTGTFVATLVAEGSVDNTNWTNLTIFPATGPSVTGGVTATGYYRIPSVGAYTQIRVRASAYTSGTVAVTMNFAQTVAAPQLFSPNAINAKVDALSSKEAQSTANQTFVVAVQNFNITPANADDVAIYIKNPSGSGKTLVLQQVLVTLNTTSGGTSAADILVKIFANPTSSANGTAATISTTSIGSGATSAMTAFTTPTVSANGTFLYTFSVGNAQPSLAHDMTAFRVAANNNILITLNSGVNNTTVNAVVVWSEE